MQHMLKVNGTLLCFGVDANIDIFFVIDIDIDIDNIDIFIVIVFQDIFTVFRCIV